MGEVILQTFAGSLPSLSIGACARVAPTNDWALESFWCMSFSCDAAYARFYGGFGLRIRREKRPEITRTDINGL